MCDGVASPVGIQNTNKPKNANIYNTPSMESRNKLKRGKTKLNSGRRLAVREFELSYRTIKIGLTEDAPKS